MERIINFYDLNEKNLLAYDKETINQLYQLIVNEKKYLNNDWISECYSVVNECIETFSTMNLNYMDYIDLYIERLKKSIPDEDILSNTQRNYHLVIRDINLYIQMLEYLKELNYSERVFFDKDKYQLMINTYNLFRRFDNQDDCVVEFDSNHYIFFYSKSSKYVSICIYHIDDLFGYKLFLTFKKSIEEKEIIINTFDVMINSGEEFYKKVKMLKGWNLLDNPTKEHNMQLVDIEQIAQSFNKNSGETGYKIEISYFESSFVDEDKMLQYVGTFLDN